MKTTEYYSRIGAISNQNRINEAENKLSIRLLEHGFGYIGGYDGRDSTIKVVHFECGTQFERHSRSFDKYGYNCPTCEAVKRKAILEERRIEQKAEREQKKLDVEARRKEIEAERQAIRNLRLDAVHSCSVCGKSYTIRRYMESVGMRYARDSGFCSKECRDIRANELKKINKRKNKSGQNHIRRVRKFGGRYDRGITLRKAVDRYGLTCYLCGKPCDWNDHTWSKYCGPTYPSIDHIIPLSKGGSHTWENIGVAHILCNSKKETTLLA